MPSTSPTYIQLLNASRRKISPTIVGGDRSRAVSQVEADRLRSSWRWKKVRNQVLREEPLCQDCKADGRTEAATTVDHVVPLQQDASLCFVRSNLRALCGGCHGKKSARERAPRARETR